MVKVKAKVKRGISCFGVTILHLISYLTSELGAYTEKRKKQLITTRLALNSFTFQSHETNKGTAWDLCSQSTQTFYCIKELVTVKMCDSD